MTFQSDSWAVDGGSTSATLARLMTRSTSRSSQGIVEIGDLRVNALGTPGSSVTVSDGACIVKGAEAQWQGSYYGYNLGSASVSITPTTGSARSDLIIVRVEDPTVNGTPWTQDPATNPVFFIRVIQGVSNTATTVPAGTSGIPLARIDIPAGTTAITQAMIKDLRVMLDPRRDRTLATHSPASLTTLTGTQETWRNFPTTATWNVSVPSWAVQCRVVLTVAGIRYTTGTVFGALRFTLGSSLTGQSVNLDDNQSGTRRQSLAVADTLVVPAAYRGTTQALKVQMLDHTGGTPNIITTDSATTFIVDVEFNEVATYDL